MKLNAKAFALPCVSAGDRFRIELRNSQCLLREVQ